MNNGTSHIEPAPAWTRRWLIGAGVYNLLWGGIVVVAPAATLRLLGVLPVSSELWPQLWGCIGMMVGVYGVGYLIAVRDPARHWPIVLVGLLGKILGPIGFVDAAAHGRLPWSMGVTLLTNDLLWWIPFGMILWHGARAAQPPPAKKAPGIGARSEELKAPRPRRTTAASPRARPRLNNRSNHNTPARRTRVQSTMRLGVRDVASQFGVPERVVLRWVDEEALPASKVDGQYRFSPAALFEWATARGMQIPPALFHEPDNGDREPLPNLVDAVRAGGFVDRIAATEKPAVLAALIGHLSLPAGVDRDDLLRIVMAREQLGATGIGEGIAIPHVRNPIVLRVPRPMIVLGLLQRPIEYGAIDGKPVHSVFLVITPTTRSHLHILSRLGYVLQDRGVRELLAHRAPTERILQAMGEVESRIPAPGGAG